MAEPRIDENGLPVYAPGDYDFVRVVDRSTGASRNALAPEVTAAARAISEALDGLVADAREDIDDIIRDLGYLSPVPYASGLSVNDIKFTVSYNGDVYAPKPELVPFTTGTWNPDQWNVIQGDINLRSDLADPTGGAGLVAFRQAGAGAVNRPVSEKLGDAVSVHDFAGVTGDGVSNDSAGLQNALNRKGTIALRSGATYFGGSGVLNISGPTHIVGNGATLKDVLIAASPGASGADVVIEGVRFTTGIASGSLPPYVFNPRNLGRVTLRNCVFDNVMAYIATNDQAARYGLVVDGCTFIANWSSFAYNTQQADCLTVFGYQGVSIRNNVFIGHNINRFLKVAVGLTSPLTPAGNPVPAMMARGVEVHGNIFLGTGAGKQLIDCYTGTVDFTFSGNYVKVSGFTAGVENKTGYAYTVPGVATSQKIINNHFEMDTVAVQMQGGWSATGWTPNAYYNLLVSGNTFMISTEDENTVGVRFFDSVIISNNQFKCVAPITSKYHIMVSSSESTVIEGNTIDGGSSQVLVSTSNANGEFFNGQPKHIVFANNVCRDYDIDAAFCARNGSAVESLIITGNSAYTTKDSAALQAAFWVRSLTARHVTVANNYARHTLAANKETVWTSFSNVDTFHESGNSWYPRMKDLANSATPSIKSVSPGSIPFGGGDWWQTGGTTAITDLLDGKIGQQVSIYAVHNCTITHGTNIKLNGSVSFAMNLYDTLTLRKVSATVWVEVSRGVN